jgi:hypothetical protein
MTEADAWKLPRADTDAIPQLAPEQLPNRPRVGALLRHHREMMRRRNTFPF